ncbi:MAG: hypothetical protein ACRD96_17470, partial [Bryobacteraceae bacterium]
EPEAVARRYGAGLAALLAWFCGRVAGQLLVACCGVTWLPPMEAWYSGLMPYGPLLASQVVILAVMGKVTADFLRDQVRPRARLGRGLWIFGWVYLAAMAVRFALGVGPTIPIVFHWVLALWTLLVAAYHRKRAAVG